MLETDCSPYYLGDDIAEDDDRKLRPPEDVVRKYGETFHRFNNEKVDTVDVAT